MTHPDRPLSLAGDAVDLFRRGRDRAATVLIWMSVLVAAVPLVFLLFHVVRQGAGIIDLEFLTSSIPISRREGPGMGPAVVGTLLITGAASAIAVPLGILAAIYLTEYSGKGRLASFIRFMSDVMSGVPSIVMGLFIYAVWVLRFRQSGFAGALGLAALMLPIVVRTAETMLKLVPNQLREASYALGARKSRTVMAVVLPAALPGLLSGVLLAIARAAGETAPLLFTIGIVQESNPNIFSGTNTALSVQIFRNAQLPFLGAQQRAWGAALTLIALVLILSVLSRLISKRFAVR